MPPSPPRTSNAGYVDKTGKVVWHDMNTSVSIDTITHRATIEYRIGGARLGTAELSPGNYTYTVYWVPQQNEDPDSVSAETLVETGQAVSGTFTVQ
jgi:hypothetical protein